MEQVAYGYSKALGRLGFAEAERRVIEALKGQGFGVLTEIDVKATLKSKLDVDFRKYKILGACNPPLAHRALSGELLIGLLLPCNVVLYEEDDGEVVVSVANPRELFKVVHNQELLGMAEEVDGKVRAALESLG